MIVNSHYVTLQPPYPVIYCNGEVGMQIGTLIVVEGPEVDKIAPAYIMETTEPPMSPYAIRTHSHPVVSYSNKSMGLVMAPVRPNDFSEGVVWDKVELGDVVVLFHVNNGDNTQDSPWLQTASDNLINRIGSLAERERTKDLFREKPTFSLKAVLRGLRRFIPVEMKVDKIQGTVGLHIASSKKNDDTVCSYPRPKKIPGLYIAVKIQDNPDATTELIKQQIEDFLIATGADREKSDILFRDIEKHPDPDFASGDPRIQPLVERLNAIYHKPENSSSNKAE